MEEGRRLGQRQIPMDGDERHVVSLAKQGGKLLKRRHEEGSKLKRLAIGRCDGRFRCTVLNDQALERSCQPLG
jgi:hypothetical protein